MDPDEVRYQLISALLQAAGPLTFLELTAQCGLSEDEINPVLKDLVSGKLVVEGELISDVSAPQYCWAARWTQEFERSASRSRQRLKAKVEPAEKVQFSELGINNESVLAFYNYVINEYKPPKDKRLLVFLQCSVRRPFSSSPSHGTMRRGIYIATGYDPRKDFQRCPVHVVVLASKIGPVPYELEDVYPANVRGGGVKHFDTAYYLRIKPILAERMAQYIITHRGNYDHITTFTEGRYGDVMKEARDIAVRHCGEDIYFAILPVAGGPQNIRGFKYWDKYWIQLYQEIVSWLDPAAQKKAEARLKDLNLAIK